MKLGVIGYGTRAGKLMEAFARQDMGVVLAAVADPESERVRQRVEDAGFPADTVHFYTEAQEMLDQERLDGVIVSTRCSLHAALAVEVMKRGVPLFLEKPVAVCDGDVALLEDARRRYDSPVLVSFPLRMTPLANLVREIIDSGRIGTVEQVQAVNNVPYGGVYYHNWYRDTRETGGLFLQKTTHDFDYINSILRQTPVEVCAVSARRVFRGDRPAGQRCPDCPEYETCLESPFVMKHCTGEEIQGDFCCYAEDVSDQDCGSAIVRYDSGVHVCYSQNFFARNGAARRGARFLGYEGTLEFDWYTDEIKVFRHHQDVAETYKMNTVSMMHGGGDNALAWNFIQMMRGRDISHAPLSAGILSAKMCLAARASAQSGTFRRI